MRAQQNTLAVTLDVQSLKITTFRRRAHHTLGGLNAEHRMLCNLARDLKRAGLDLSGRHTFLDDAQVAGGAPVDLAPRENKHPRHARAGALLKKPARPGVRAAADTGKNLAQPGIFGRYDDIRRQGQAQAGTEGDTADGGDQGFPKEIRGAPAIMNLVHHFRCGSRAFGNLRLKADQIPTAAEMIATGHDNCA